MAKKNRRRGVQVRTYRHGPPSILLSTRETRTKQPPNHSPPSNPTLPPRLQSGSEQHTPAGDALLLQLPTLDFHVGDRIELHLSLNHDPKEAILIYHAEVTARFGFGKNEMFTFRRQVLGKPRERTFPVHSPRIVKILVTDRGSPNAPREKEVKSGGSSPPSIPAVPKPKVKKHKKKKPKPSEQQTPKCAPPVFFSASVAPTNHSATKRKLTVEEAWAEQHLEGDWWR